MADAIFHGYWDLPHIAGELYPPIREANEYNGQEVLGIAYARPGDTAAKRKKILKEWCDVLPTLKIKVLSFYAGHQDLFNAATRIKGLEALVTGYGSIYSIASIVNCKSLQALNISSKPSLTGVNYVNQLRGLKVLNIDNVREARDLSFVGSMTSLEEFGICGSIWSTQYVNDLWPLANLKGLRSIFLLSTRVLKDGLRPLHQLPNLVNLMCAFYYPASEFSALRKALPSLMYGTPFDERIKNYPRLASS